MNRFHSSVTRFAKDRAPFLTIASYGVGYDFIEIPQLARSSRLKLFGLGPFHAEASC